MATMDVKGSKTTLSITLTSQGGRSACWRQWWYCCHWS